MVKPYWRSGIAIIATLMLVAVVFCLAPSSALAYYAQPSIDDSYTAPSGFYTAGLATGGGLMYPAAFATAADGKLWAVMRDDSDGHICRYSSVGVPDRQYDLLGSQPTAAAFGPNGKLYVADGNNNDILVFNTASGTVDATMTGSGVFTSATDLQFDSNGRLFVVDRDSNAVVRYPASLTNPTSFDGAAQLGATPLSSPSGVSIDAGGNVWIADRDNGRVVEFSNDGSSVIRTVSLAAGSPMASPLDVYVDGYGTLYTVGIGVQGFSRYNVSGAYLGTYPTPDIGTVLNSTKIAVDSWGNVMVNDGMDWAADGQIGAWTYSAAHADVTPPTTTCDGPTGWSYGPLQVNFHAVDSMVGSAAPSGVTATRYVINPPGSYVDYTATVTISAEGTTTLAYYSLDAAGNAETPKSTTLLVDNGPPVTNVTVNPLYYSTAIPTFNLVASDSGSGVAYTKFRVDGGAWTTGTVIAPPTSPTADGTHTLDWYSSDLAGRKESTRTATYEVVTHAEQSDSRIAYMGSWSLNTTDTNASGGSHSSASHSGDKAVMSFKGTRLDYNSMTGPSLGIANVRLDGGATKTVDLYTSGTQYKRKVWTTGNVSDTTHTVEISYSGTKNASSSGYNVDLDSIDTFGFLGQADVTPPVTTSDAPVAWTRPPLSVSLSAFDAVSGVDLTYYSLDGSTPSLVYIGVPIQLSTEGTTTLLFRSIDHVGNMEATQSATVRLDGTAPNTTATIQPSYVGTATVIFTTFDALSGVANTRYSVDGAASTTGTVATVTGAGTHTLSFRSADNAGNNEPTQTVSFDVLKRYDQNDARVYYKGAWTTTSSAGRYGGNWATANTAGTGAYFNFTGTRFELIGSTGPGRGIGQVSLDGSVVGTADFYSASSLDQRRVFALGGLAQATHTVKLEWTGTKSAPSTDTVIGLDAVDVATVLTTDTTPPSTAGNADNYWYQPPFQLTLTPTDLGSWVATSYISVNGTTSAYLGTMPISTEGTNTIKYWSVDGAGNVETTHTASVKIDSLVPDSWDNAPTSWISTGCVVALSGSDSESGVNRIRVGIGNGAEFTYATPLAMNSEGSTPIYYYAVDNAGNVEPLNTSYVNIDRTPPVTTATVLPEYSGSASISLIPTDTGIGVIASTKWRIDGSAWTSGTVASTGVGGAHTLDFYSTDGLGNVEPTKTVTFAIYDRYESSNPWFNVYPGYRWYTQYSGVYSGGSERYTTKSGGWASFMFNGTSFRLIASTASGYATATVTIDNGTPTVIDLSAPPLGNQKVVYSSPVLDNTQHTVRLWSWCGNGTKQLRFDAVDILGELVLPADMSPPTTTSNIDTAWHNSPFQVVLSPYDGISGVMDTEFSLDNGNTWTSFVDSFTVSPEGTNTVLWYSTDNAGNQEETQSANVLIDYTAPVSSSDATSGWNAGATTVHLSSADAKSGVAGIRYAVNGSVAATYTTGVTISTEGTNTLSFRAIDNAGNWETSKTATIKIDTKAPTTTSNAVASYPNTATITLTPTDAGCGVTGTFSRLDFTTWVAGTVVSTSTLTPGTHSLEFYSVDALGHVEDQHIAYFEVLKRYEDTDSHILYHGGWNSSPNASRSNGAWTFANSSGAAAYVTFTGTHIDLIGSTAPTYGIARVTLDAGAPEDADFYSSGYNHQVKVWTRAGLANTAHTVKIEWTGTKNVASSGTVVGIDALDVVSTLTSDSLAPVTTSTADAAWRSTPETVTLTATDANSWVANSYYRVGATTTTYTVPFAVSGEGTSSIQFWSVDAAGNVESSHTATVRIDRIAPTSSDDATSPWIHGPATIHLSSADAGSGVDHLLYSLDGSEPTLTYTTSVTVSAEGTTTLKYKGVDGVGNAEAARSASVRIDNTPPTLSDDAPSGWNAGPVTIHLAASDPLSGADKTWVSVNGGSATVYSSPVTVSNEGTTTVEYWSADVVGNTSAHVIRTVLVDNTAPHTSDNAPTAWVHGPVSVSLIASDAVSGVQSTYYSLNGGGPQLYSVPFAVSAEGTTSIEYWSIDVKGNAESHRFATARIDNSTPQTTDDAPGGWMKNTRLVTLSASDTYSGVATTWASIDGTAATACLQPVAFTDGTHTLSYRSVDNVGNSETSHTATVHVDSVPPTSTASVAPSYWATATLTISPSDAVAGVASTQWRIDAGGWNAGTAVTLPFAPGFHTLEWLSTDNAGNSEATKSATYDMLQRSDDLNSGVYYHNSWSQGAKPERYSAAWSFINSAGEAYFNFSGTRFDLLGSTAPGYGIAKVSVDGNLAGYADFYASGYGNQVKVFSQTGLSNAPHHVKVEWTGTKNAASNGTVIGVDAVDVSGNMLADNTPPVTLTSIDSAWRTTPETVTMSATDTGTELTTINYWMSGASSSTVQVYGSTGPFQVNAEGTTTVQFRSNDLANNFETTNTALVRIDRTAPSSSDDATSAWQRGPVTVHVTSSDAGSGVDHVLYSNDGSAPSLLYTNGMTVSAEGTTTLKYRAIDAVGNTESVKSTTIRVDSSVPAISDDAPSGWVDGPVTVHIVSSDALSGLAHTWAIVDGSSAVEATQPIMFAAEGTHTVEYWAADNAGNANSHVIRTFGIDHTTPVTSDNAPSAWVNGPVTVSLAASDAISGVGSTNYLLNGVGPQSYSSPLSISAEGTNTLEYWSVDVKGNAESHHLASVRIDNGAPLTTDDAAPGWMKSSQAIALTASDALSGLGATYFSIDGLLGSVYTVPLVLSAEGTHTLSYRSADIVGNSETSHTVTVRVDNTPPTSSAAVAGSYPATANITINTSDALSGLASTQWRIDGSAWTSGTAVVYPFTVGSHTLNWYSADKAGNVEATHSATFEMLGRVDDLNTRIYYRGSWAQASKADRYLGYWTYANTSGAAAYFTFAGTHFDLIGSNAPTYGIGRLIVDGAVVGYPDFYSSGYNGQVKLFSVTGLPNTTHTARLEWTGTKNASSAGYVVGIDALDIAGTLVTDTVAPLTTSTIDSSWRSTPQTVSLTATDTNTWVASSYYRIGSTTTTYTAPFQVSAEGTTSVQYWSADTAGNAETSTTALVRIDRTAPSSSDDATTSWVTGPLTMHVTSSDAGSGVDHILYSTDGSDPTLPYTAAGIVVSLDGTTTIKYKAVDAVGNTEVARSKVVHVDSTAPATSDDAPVGWVSGPVVVHITSSDSMSGVAHTWVSINGLSAVEASQPIAFSAEGTDTIEYWAADNAGNSTSHVIRTVQIDHTAPVTTDNAPLAWGNGPVTVSLTANDPVSGVMNTYCSVNGATAQVYLTPLAVSAEGTTTLEYWSVDNEGNAETHHVATVRVDNSAPQTTDNSVAGWMSGITSPIALTSHDQLSGVGSTFVSLDGQPATLYAGPLTLAAEGTRTVSYRSVDTVGNSETSHSVTVHVDNTAPVSTATVSASYAATANVSITTSDALSGVAQTQWRIDGSSWTSGTAIAYPFTVGAHTLNWFSADKAGNAETMHVATFEMLGRVDQLDPRIYYCGTWGTSGNASRYNGSWAFANASGSSAYFTFTGTHFDLIGSNAPTYGIARVWVDGAISGYADFYSSGYNHMVKLFSATGLANTTHQVKIEWTGTKNPSSNGTVVGIDAFDVAGTLVTDTVPPTTTITGSAAWRTTPQTISLSAADAGTWVANTFYRIGSTTTTYSTPFQVSAEGATNVQVWSVDGAGNSESTQTLAVQIDRIAPSSSSDASSAWMHGPETVHVSATDAGSGVAQTLYSTDGSDPNVPFPPAGASFTAEGTTTIKFKSVDTVGNVEATKTATIRIDNTAPVTLDDVGSGWITSSRPIHLSATDSLSGVAQTLYALDAGSAQPYSGAFTIASEGSHVLCYASRDNAANAETTHSVVAMVDNTAPVSTATVAASYTTTAATTISISDNLSGVASTHWRIDGSAWTTGTAVSIPSAPGYHTLQFYSNDMAGNTESTKTLNYEMIGRVEDSDARILYSSGWSPAPKDGRSAGSWSFTNAAGSVAYMTFTGTRIALLGSTAPSYGIARVTVDSGTVEFADFYDPNYLNQKVVWQRTGLPNTPHVVKIEWSGTKNAASSGTVIGIDAFDLAAQVSATLFRAEETDPKIMFTGTWSAGAKSDRSGGSWNFTNTSQSVAYVAFSGTRFDLIGSKAPGYGIAKVTIDNTTTANVDFYDPGYLGQQCVYSLSGLSNGNHSVKIEWTGTKNGASSGTVIGVDAVDISGFIQQATTPDPAMTRYDDVDGHIAFTGTWSAGANSSRYNGAWQFTNAQDSASYIAFSGTRLDLIGSRSPGLGIASISVDGGAPVSVDFYDPNYLNQQRIWSSGTLAAGNHTVVVSWTGTKNSSSAGTQIGVDAVDVAGTISQAVPPVQTTRYEDADSHLFYTGTWAPSANSGRSGGSWSFTNTSGSACYVAFTGTRFDLIASKNPGLGIVNITIDSSSSVAVDLYDPNYLNQVKVLSQAGLSNTTHTVKIEWTGTKNASSSGTAVGVDAVDIIGTLNQAVSPLPPMNRFEETDSNLAYVGLWSSGSNAARSAGAWAFSNSPTATVYADFTGTRFDLIASKAPSYGIVRVTIDGNPTLVDLYDPNYLSQQRAFSAPNLASGPHTVKIEATGTNNASSTGFTCGIDAIDLVGNLTQATAP